MTEPGGTFRAMDPTEALLQAELVLRSLIRSVLGSSWREVPGLPSESKLADRRRGEEANRQGVEVSQEPMDYLYIYDLKTIFDQRRNQFGEVFPNKWRFEQFINILVDYRNTPMHARSLAWFEKDLVTGASGYIVACITRWRNLNDAEQAVIYPEILSVTDDTGAQWTHPTFPSSHGPLLGTLDIGQELHLHCEGADADGRDLLWSLFSGPDPFTGVRVVTSAEGNPATLTWTPGIADVSPGRPMCIAVSAMDEYPRRLRTSLGGVDAYVQARYAVRRPRKLTPRTPVL